MSREGDVSCPSGTYHEYNNFPEYNNPRHKQLSQVRIFSRSRLSASSREDGEYQTVRKCFARVQARLHGA